jgi:hypothetical protein
MFDYQAVLLEAIERFIQIYESGNVRLHTEADLQAHFFHHCLQILQEHQAELPYRLHCRDSIAAVREKIDMILGDNEVIVEFKLEPDYPELSPSQKPRVFPEDIRRDFDRMQRYCDQGVPHGYTILLDEDGCHLRAFPNVSWRKISIGMREAYLLVRHFQPGAE